MSALRRLRPVARRVGLARLRNWYQGRPAVRQPAPPVVRSLEVRDREATFQRAERVRGSAMAQIDGLTSTTLPPEGLTAYSELLYRTILRRSPDAAAMKEIQEQFEAGSLTRARLTASLIRSSEFAELQLLEDILKDLQRSPQTFSVGAERPIGPGTGERVIEIPWMLSRWRGERRVLDVGYAFAGLAYLAALLDLGVPELHGVDMAVREVPHVHRTRADVRRLPYRANAFDLVICISTLEHIGLDNRRYGLEPSPPDPSGQLQSLLEMTRVLRPGGRLLVSVPLGKHMDYGWFIQYDWRTWKRLINRTQLVIEEQEQFRLDPEGWTRVDSPRATESLLYQDGAPGAKAVLCASLVRPG